MSGKTHDNGSLKLFDARLVLPGISLGIVSGILTVVLMVSFAALVFGGPLAPHLNEGIGITLFAAAVSGFWVSFRSAFPGVVAMPQDSSTAIVAPISAALAADIIQAGTEFDPFQTVLAAVGISTIFSGLIFMLIGRLRKAVIVRYVPYPVIGGFLAGTGWLLVSGGIQVMTGLEISLSKLSQLWVPSTAILWLPGFTLACIIFLCLRKWTHFLILPGLILLSFGLFYAFLGISGISPGAARDAGALLGPFSEGSSFKPRLIFGLTDVDWMAVFSSGASLLSVALVAAISLLLNASGIEILSRRELDLNRELQVAGVANLLAGMGSAGPAACHTLSISSLGLKVGANTRIIGFTSVACCLVALWLGPSLLAWFPTFLLGGLLVFLGFSFLAEWVVDSWSKLSLSDYIIVWVILVAMNLIGILPGVALGIVIALVVFVLDYSRIETVRREFTAETHRSNVERPPEAVEQIDDMAKAIRIFQLQGFLFFGSAHQVLERIRQRHKEAPIRHCLLDFKRVYRMDVSALHSFRKLLNDSETNGFTVYFVQPGREVKAQLLKTFASFFDAGRTLHFDSLDRALEKCEEDILPLRSLNEEANWPMDLQPVLKKLPERSFNCDEVLIYQDQPHRTILFIQAGEVSILRNRSDAGQDRLKKLGPGSLLGEIGFFAKEPASASVVARTDGRLLYCGEEDFRQLEMSDPKGACTLVQWMLEQSAKRNQRLIRTVEILKE